MMAIGIQLVGIVLGIIIIYEARLLFKKGQFSRRDWLIWGVLGALMLVFSAFPTLSIYFTRLTSLQRGLDAFIALALFGVYALVFQVYV